MKLFFFNKSKTFKGYLRQKDIPDLDFYSKRTYTLAKVKHFIDIVSGFYFIDFATGSGEERNIR